MLKEGYGFIIVHNWTEDCACCNSGGKALKTGEFLTEMSHIPAFWALLSRNHYIQSCEVVEFFHKLLVNLGSCIQFQLIT